MPCFHLLHIFVRDEADREKVLRFLSALGARVHGQGCIYLTGGGTAVFHGWRDTTIDFDLKAVPEPAGFFEAIAALKDKADINVELASLDDFIPELPGWQDQSAWIARHGKIDVFHYDFYAQALAKSERRHSRDLGDVQAMIDRKLIALDRLWSFFLEIGNRLIRYPAIERGAFRQAVKAVCQPGSEL